MTQRVTNRRQFASYAAMILLAFFVLRIPAVQNAIADALIEFVEITQRTLRFPCALLNHDKCFSLDRFDPTCPPYL
jgi:hypothetical protein